MGKCRVVGLNEKAFVDSMMKELNEQQCQLFVDYAQNKIQEIGDAIKNYHSSHNMDRTGNLLDSLCWGVSYNGKLLESGFYRTAQASQESGLHEWSKVSFYDRKNRMFAEQINADEPINGRRLAEEYLKSYGNNGKKGWKVFFAILAKYWGYWERGFTLKTNFGKSSRFLQFAVMTQFHDQVKADLKPASTKISVSVPHYASRSLFAQAKKNWY